MSNAHRRDYFLEAANKLETRRKHTATITEREYGAFQTAYNFFNKKLFKGSLPHVMVTFQRHAKAKGYFHPDKFSDRANGEQRAHELAMNPDVFTGRTDEEILSTLAHEMCHVWQETNGTAPRRAYHDREFAEKMKAIGLQPTSDGTPQGKETGQNMTHIIMPTGNYHRAYRELKAQGFALNWQSNPEGEGERKKKAASKTKYTCPACAANAWAKPETALICGSCYDEEDGEITIMEPEEEAA